MGVGSGGTCLILRPSTPSGFSSASGLSDRTQVLAFGSLVPVSLALGLSPQQALLSCGQPGALESRGLLLPCLLPTCCGTLGKLLYLSVCLPFTCKLGIKSLALAILPGSPEESMGSSLWICFTQAHVWERLVPKTVRHWSCGGGSVLGRIHNPVQLLIEQGRELRPRGSHKVGARKPGL